MTHREKQPSEMRADQAGARSKKPYARPSFRWESLAFETMALSCGKISSSQGTCHSNTKNS